MLLTFNMIKYNKSSIQRPGFDDADSPSSFPSQFATVNLSNVCSSERIALPGSNHVYSELAVYFVDFVPLP